MKANYSYVIFVIKGINIFCVLKCFSKNFLYWDCLTKLFYRFYNCVSFFAASEICNRVHGQCLPAVYLRHDKTAIWQKHGWLRERERDREGGGGVLSYKQKNRGLRFAKIPLYGGGLKFFSPQNEAPIKKQYITRSPDITEYANLCSCVVNSWCK